MKKSLMRNHIFIWGLAAALVALLAVVQPAQVVQAAGGSPTDDFVITVKTNYSGSSSSTQYAIPTYPGGTYNYNVDCNNDGTFEASAQTGSYTCSYAAAGTYTVRIQDNTGLGTGFPRFYANQSGDAQKLLTIAQWGTGKWTSMNSAFKGCNALTMTATDKPDLSGVTDMSAMFSGASSFNGAVGGWDTSHVTDMSYLFNMTMTFNQNISGWNTSNVTNMGYMLANTWAFNQPLTAWDTSKVTNMHGMFGAANAFNQSLSSWNTSSVIDMMDMFVGATAFNGSIGSWDTHNVTTMRTMFEMARTFNQDISSWNTSKVTSMNGMFSDANAFDQDLSAWDVGALTDAGSMFLNSKLSSAHYDALLNGWSAQTLKPGVIFSGGSSTYCAVSAHNKLTAAPNNWTITDGGTTCTVPGVTGQPQNQSVLVGETVSFSAAADGSPAPGLQWQVSSDGGNNWADIAGATSSPLSFSAAYAQNASQYRAVFSSAAGSVTTNAASLAVAKKTAVCTVTGWSGKYDGLPHGASGSCTGMGGAVLSGLDLGATYTNVPGGTAHWTFSGGSDYLDQSGDVAIVIEKAPVKIYLPVVLTAYNGSPTPPSAVGSNAVAAMQRY